MFKLLKDFLGWTPSSGVRSLSSSALLFPNTGQKMGKQVTRMHVNLSACVQPGWAYLAYLRILERFVWGESAFPPFPPTSILCATQEQMQFESPWLSFPQRLRLGANRGTMAEKRYLPQMLDQFCFLMPVFRRPTYDPLYLFVSNHFRPGLD